jgi:transcriptional regulator of acetoin/glycerol metabolism
VTTRTVIKPTPDGLRAALTESGGNVSAAAKELGVSRVTVHKWMREYGLAVQRVIKPTDEIPDLVA